MGLWLNTPQKPAGTRSEPPMSEPISSDVTCAARAAAAPPDEPPQVRARSQGLFVVPYRALDVCQSPAITGVLVLPQTTAPARRAWLTAAASPVIRRRSSARPDEAAMPATSNVSLTVIGRPDSGPRVSPRARASSRARARSSARSGSAATTALIAACVSAWRARDILSSSTAETRLAARAANWPVASWSSRSLT